MQTQSLPRTTKAAILTELRTPLVVGSIRLPEELDVGQVLVQVHFSGICGSQLGEINGAKGTDPYLPHLLGHEGSATVLHVGPGVSHLAAGDRVVLHWRKGKGIESRTPTYEWNGREINAGWVTTFNGLKVILPTSPHDAKGMLISAIEDENPVICLEHRWLYGVRDSVPKDDYRVPIGEAKVVRSGTDITIVGVSYMTLECVRAAELLSNYGVHAEVIDLRSASPLDFSTILESVARTGRVLTVDHAHGACGIGSEISALAAGQLFSELQGAPRTLSLPDHPTPTSSRLTSQYYSLPHQIANACSEMVGNGAYFQFVGETTHALDQVNRTFHGPF